MTKIYEHKILHVKTVYVLLPDSQQSHQPEDEHSRLDTENQLYNESIRIFASITNPSYSISDSEIEKNKIILIEQNNARTSYFNILRPEIIDKDKAGEKLPLSLESFATYAPEEKKAEVTEILAALAQEIKETDKLCQITPLDNINITISSELDNIISKQQQKAIIAITYPSNAKQSASELFITCKDMLGKNEFLNMEHPNQLIKQDAAQPIVVPLYADLEPYEITCLQGQPIYECVKEAGIYISI